MNNHTKGIFFDLYGTLLILGDMKQAWADWIDVFYRSLCAQGLALSKSEFCGRCEQFFSQPEPPADDSGLTVFERRLRRVAESLGLRIERPQLANLATRMCAAWQAHVRLDPEAPQLLSRLQSADRKLALISNFDHPPYVRQVLRSLELERFFSTILISGEVGFKKPDAQIFRLALGATRLQAHEVIHVGDTADDVEGAKAAGLRPIWLSRVSDPRHVRILDYTQNANAPEHAGFSGLQTIAALSEIIG